MGCMTFVMEVPDTRHCEKRKRSDRIESDRRPADGIAAWIRKVKKERNMREISGKVHLQIKRWYSIIRYNPRNRQTYKHINIKT